MTGLVPSKISEDLNSQVALGAPPPLSLDPLVSSKSHSVTHDLGQDGSCLDGTLPILGSVGASPHYLITTHSSKNRTPNQVELHPTIEQGKNFVPMCTIHLTSICACVCVSVCAGVLFSWRLSPLKETKILHEYSYFKQTDSVV